MTLWKGQVPHLALLGVAAVLAFGVWTRDDQALSSLKPSEVEVWAGSPDSVAALKFESKTRKVSIEPQKDALGRWYVVTVDKEEPSPGNPAPGADAGAAATPPKHTTLRFVSVKAADELLKSLAPLHALRAVGKVEGTRAEEFGFDKPEGTLHLTVNGKAQSLTIGGTTPGGSERYAKAGNGDVFAITGDIVQNLLFAEARLTEHELQPFKPAEATRVKVTKAGKSKDLVRVPEKNEGWADRNTPTKLDETAGNWMTKLGRLHVLDWVEKPSVPVGQDNLVVRVDYFAGSKALGSLELYRIPGEKGNDYLAKTEYGRWLSRVVQSGAEQIDQDSASIVK